MSSTSMRIRLASAVLVTFTLSLSPSLALAEGPAPSAATPEQRESAQKSFLRGKELFGEKRFTDALAAFDASLEDVASPNTRLFAARCLRELGRLPEAYAAFARVVSDAKANAQYSMAASTAEEERQELERKLGFLRIAITHATPSTRVTIGGSPVADTSSTDAHPVTPGEAVVVVETTGQPPITRTVAIAAGATETLAIDLSASAPPPAPPPSEEPRSLRPYAYVAGGIALAGLATFGAFALMTSSTYSDLESACGSGPCPRERADDVSAGRTQQTVANVGLAVFAIGAAAAVTLYVVGAPKRGATPQARVVMRGTGLGLEGAF